MEPLFTPEERAELAKSFDQRKRAFLERLRQDTEAFRRVVKVEGERRQEGARRGPEAPHE